MGKAPKKPAGLSPKQQRFVAEYLIDSNATQAAIRAGYSERTAKQQGSRLLTYADIAAAVSAARRPVLIVAKCTLEDHLQVLADLRDEARAANQYAAAITAEANRGKVSGHYVEKVEDVTKPIPTDERKARVLTLLTDAKRRKSAS